MPGTIIFKPIEANIISKDQDVLGKMDPYLSFHLGGLKRVKGEVAKTGGQHPIWNDAITVEVSNQTSLTVDVKDKDMLIDDKIASFEVDLREVESQGRVRKWYPIFRKNEPAGELLMEATFSGGSGQFGTGLNQGQYAGVGGLSQGQGQYGTGLSQGQGQYGTGLSQGQGQYGSGLSQGQYGTGLSQGQYGTSGLSQGQGQYGTSGLSQGQYGTSGLSQGQGYSATGFTGSNIYGQSGSEVSPIQGYSASGSAGSRIIGQSGSEYSTIQGYSASGSAGSRVVGQSGNVITTPGTVISHTSTSHPVQSTQYTSGGLQQGTQYGSVPLGGLQQGQYGTSSLQQGQYGSLPQGQLGGLQSGQFGGLQQGQGYGSQVSSEQFAKEALLRGSDPLNTRQNEYYNLGQGGLGQGGLGQGGLGQGSLGQGSLGQGSLGQGGLGQGSYGQGPQQNLTQTPYFSGTDPLLYEGDKNRFSNPPQQVPYKGKTVEDYGHHGKHATQGTGTMNPSSNPNPGYY